MSNTNAKYATQVSQSTGGRFVSWSNLNNIRNAAKESYAVSSVLIKGKSESPNRPSTVSCTGFGFNLPVGAEPTKVTIEYNHKKNKGSNWTDMGKEICNIPAPTISLLGVSGFSSKGVAPGMDFIMRKKTFNVTGKLKRSDINSANFGVKIDYPANTNNYNGWLSLGYVRIIVEYTPSRYSVSVKKVTGGYNGDDYIVQLTISNVNRTSYKPTLTLSSPAGFSYKSSGTGTGTITQRSARSFTWDPKLPSKGSVSINVTFSTNVTFPTGSSSYVGIFTLAESLNGTSGSLNAVITPRPPGVDTEDEPQTEDITVETTDQLRLNHSKKQEEFQFTFQLTDDEWDLIYESEQEGYPIIDGPIFKVTDEEDLLKIYDNNWVMIGNDRTVEFDSTSHTSTALLKGDSVGTTSLRFDAYYTVDVSGVSVEVVRTIATFLFEVEPNEEDLTIPFFTYLEPTGEELDRLGSGFPYIIQAYLKHTTTDEYERDWYKNNRIGVFNNPIEANITVETIEVDGEPVDLVVDVTDYNNLSDDEIFENAEYWSEAPTTVNEYNNMECEFTYNENYPLYIIFTGDYLEAEDYGYDGGDITYTEPCIVEKTVYNMREHTGNYPIPIKNIITNEGDSAEVTIPVLDTTTPVIIYDYPLEDGYGNNEDLSIRGIQIDGTLQQTDELVIQATLTTPDGISGTRSIILDVDKDSFTLGGLGDLWGFQPTELINLEDWELQMSINNLLNDETTTINYGDITLTLYTETVLKQNINISVEGEDLSFYGCFTEDVIIPEGLETDTAYLSIDGTDMNDAYRQNIREKDITLELSLGECDYQTSTDMLRQLAKLLVNERDEYNRPIPKRIEFTHYPDVYFEYVMEKPLDITKEISGYNIKATLTIPNGTAYDKEDTTTNINGNVQGLAKINPIITILPQSEEINITETISGQSFNMGFDGDWQSYIVEINCIDREVLLKTSEDDNYPINISKYVDFNSDWFNLHGEYSFSSTGCVIRTVTFTERW